jgi:hypothetical protein
MCLYQSQPSGEYRWKRKEYAANDRAESLSDEASTHGADSSEKEAQCEFGWLCLFDVGEFEFDH